ncbi:unnamed protein product [Tetraodon nigroviridis]|uniref:Chromosome 15 SCAF14992, whole genome shotgun sequence n=1 Tax=Tetraodon nigroviridis TaxID=99883 RepID=Q4RVE1_TETNG|nr:unnamed protein product [Tetraodon nigroviridis]
MEFRATGHRAADIQLDIGADDPLPLNQVPKSCGYTMRKSALDFVLAVSYDGCNIIRENGIYVLKMRWLNASVEFICSVTSSSELPDQYEFQFQEPELPSVRSGRPRRQTTEQFYYNPCSLYPYYYYACLYYYYMYMMNLAHASQTQTATIAAPQVPTANPPGDGKQMPLYYYYFHPYYYQGENVPVKVPQSSECDWTADAQQRPQCSNIPPGHVKWPFYPSSGPTQQGFPGSPLLPQVPQQHHGKYPQQKVPQLSSLKKPGKPHHPSKYKPSPTTTTAPPATVRTTPCPTQGPVTTTTLCPTQGPVTTTTLCPTQGPVTTTTLCPTQGPVTTTTPCPATTTPCPTQGPVTTTTPCPATTTPCPNQEGPITTTTTPCSDQEGSITSCDGVVSKYVPYQNLVFQPYVSYEGGRSAGGPQKIPEPSLDFTGRAHPPAFSGLEGHDPVLMPSLYQEGALVGNPWFYYYSFPYVE